MPASTNSSMAQLLAVAAQVLSQVTHRGRSLDDALQGRGDHAISLSALRALSFGTLRWYPRIQCWIEVLVQKPAELQPELHALLSLGLHQLEFSHHPPHAIVDGAVEATRILHQPRASGLVNAV